MLLRRDGSIDFRMLGGRLVWYGIAVALALAIGTLVSFFGS